MNKTVIPSALPAIPRNGVPVEYPVGQRGFESDIIRHLNPKLFQKEIDKSIATRIKQTDAIRLKILPLKFLENDHIEVAMLDSLNLPGEDFIQRIFHARGKDKLAITRRLVTSMDLQLAIDYVFGMDELTIDKNDEQEELVEDEGQILHDNPNDKPAIKTLRRWLREAINRRVSDIHLEPVSDDCCRIRFRIDGVMNNHQDGIPIEHYRMIINWLKIQAKRKIEETRLPQDGGFYIRTNSSRIDVRFSSLPIIYGEKIVMRLLDLGKADAAEERIEDILWSADIRKHFLQALKYPNGMVIVTGPTGSGKTTTLQSALKYVQQYYAGLQHDKNIVTVEDPVEYRIPGINQVSVKESIGLTFAACLRSILRQDPDVIMIGEIRDSETAEIGVRAALTGHLVLSTLHTNDAISAIPRLVNLGLRPDLLANTLRLLQAQRLVRRLCTACKQRVTDTSKLEEKLKAAGLPGWLRSIDASQIFEARGEGCNECENTGYKGRIAIMETLPINSRALRAMIENNASIDEMLIQARKDGYRTIMDYGMELVQSGNTSIDEILALAIEASTDDLSNIFAATPAAERHPDGQQRGPRPSDNPPDTANRHARHPTTMPAGMQLDINNFKTRLSNWLSPNN